MHLTSFWCFFEMMITSPKTKGTLEQNNKNTNILKEVY